MTEHLGLKRDAELAKELEVSHEALTRVRSGENDVSANLILRIYDLSNWPVEHIRDLAGIKKGAHYGTRSDSVRGHRG